MEMTDEQSVKLTGARGQHNVQRQDTSSNECTGLYFDKMNRQENLGCPESSQKNRIASSTSGKKDNRCAMMYTREDDKTTISLFKYTEQKGRENDWSPRRLV